MRIRCSKGLRISAFHGHFFIRSSDLLALPQVCPQTLDPLRTCQLTCSVFGCITIFDSFKLRSHGQLSYGYLSISVTSGLHASRTTLCCAGAEDKVLRT